jgi:hypothetical protein
LKYEDYLVPLKVSIPEKIHQTSLPSNFPLHSVGKLYGIFSLQSSTVHDAKNMQKAYLLPPHGRQVPDITNYGPGGHHHQQVGHDRVARAEDGG